MGSSPSANICFGVEVPYERPPLVPDRYIEKTEWGDYLKDEHEAEFEDIYEPLDLLVREEGIDNPWDDYPKLPDEVEQCFYPKEKEYLEEHFPEWCQRLDKYRAEKDRLEQTIPISVVNSGYNGEDHYHVIALKDALDGHHDYGAKRIDIPNLLAQVTPERIKAAADFCERFELIEFKDPSWYVVTSYG